MVQYLVEQGTDIHVFEEEALLLAAKQGHLPVVQYLIEQGADLEVGLAIARSSHGVEALRCLEWMKRIQEGAGLLEVLSETDLSVVIPRVRM